MRSKGFSEGLRSGSEGSASGESRHLTFPYFLLWPSSFFFIGRSNLLELIRFALVGDDAPIFPLIGSLVVDHDERNNTPEKKPNIIQKITVLILCDFVVSIVFSVIFFLPNERAPIWAARITTSLF